MDEYYKEKWRGYGGNVVTVFSELQKEDCANPHGPATKQFDGQVRCICPLRKPIFYLVFASVRVNTTLYFQRGDMALLDLNKLYVFKC